MSNKSFNPLITIIENYDIEITGIALQYQDEDSNWHYCGDDTDNFLDKCVEFTYGVDTREDAIELMSYGEELRNNTEEYNLCRIKEYNKPIQLNIEGKSSDGWEKSTSPLELIYKALSVRDYGSMTEIAFLLSDGEELPLQQYSFTYKIRGSRLDNEDMIHIPLKKRQNMGAL